MCNFIKVGTGYLNTFPGFILCFILLKPPAETPALSYKKFEALLDYKYCNLPTYFHNYLSWKMDVCFFTTSKVTGGVCGVATSLSLFFQSSGIVSANMAVSWFGAMRRLLQNSHAGLCQKWAQL